MQALHDRVALVTGASSGIGAAIAAALGEEGCRVALIARRRDKLEELARCIDPALERVMVLPTDLRREEDIGAAFAQVRERWGPVQILINNAGLGHATGLVNGDTEMWREMLEVNVLALCICTREALRDMVPAGDGHVVHVSSMSAHRVPPGSGMYSATKYAVRSLTEGLRQELRELGAPVRVSSVSPGFVETEFAEKFHRDAEAAKRTYSAYPVLRPEDVASTVMHLLRAPAHVQIHDVLMRPTEQPL